MCTIAKLDAKTDVEGHTEKPPRNDAEIHQGGLYRRSRWRPAADRRAAGDRQKTTATPASPRRPRAVLICDLRRGRS
jgi:hypothetical protein